MARFPEDARTFPELVRKADIALYEAKRRGKDQHVYYSDKLSPLDQGRKEPLPPAGKR